MSKILEVKNLYKSFEGSSVLSDVSFQIEQGELVAIMGQSGCGKSTLLYSISGMDKPTKGEVIFCNQRLSDLSEKEMEKLRLNQMGFIFQKGNLLKNLSMEDNIIFPALQTKKKKRHEIMQEAKQLMEQMGILHVAGHDIRKVSGGELQRAAICRAMINHPDILFGDEPTGALNSSATKEVMDILEEINENGTTILLVTHDAKVAARADRVIYLEDGKIKSEMKLDYFSKEGMNSREKWLLQWLAEMGF